MVASLIYNQVQLVKANQAQCRTLVKRIKIVESAVKGLEKSQDKKQYEQGLNELFEGLNRCLDFVKQFSNGSWWSRNILKAGTYQAQFQGINHALEKSMTQLNLGLAAQQIVNREQDKADQAADFAFIKENQALIIDLNYKELEEIQKLHLQQQEQHQVLLLQLASIRGQMKGIIQAKPGEKPDESKHQIPYFDLVFEQKIASGAFGTVFKGRWNQETVAIKTLSGKFTEKEEALFAREVAIMSDLRHPHIVSFYGACLEDGHACYVMEHMAKGTLASIVAQGLKAEQQKSLALDIAKGINYLHHRKIWHRDLKSTNILIDAHGVAKLADFGLSKSQAANVHSIQERSTAIQWQAPECLDRGGVYTEASDIYSFGVLLWEIVTGKSPSPVKPKELSHYAKTGAREKIPANVPLVFAKLIKACWETDPKNRPELKEIMEQLETNKPRSVSPPPEDYFEQAQENEKQKDYVAAFEAYQKASSKGHIKAKTNMGLFFLKGQGTEQDKKQAHDYFLAAMVFLKIFRARLDGTNKLNRKALQQQSPNAKNWKRFSLLLDRNTWTHLSCWIKVVVKPALKPKQQLKPRSLKKRNHFHLPLCFSFAFELVTTWKSSSLSSLSSEGGGGGLDGGESSFNSTSVLVDFPESLGGCLEAEADAE